jgi:hypothetical protein
VLPAKTGEEILVVKAKKNAAVPDQTIVDKTDAKSQKSDNAKEEKAKKPRTKS